MREATIWYTDAGGDNVITLSDEFYAEISAHPIPTNLDVVPVTCTNTGSHGSLRLAVLSLLYGEGPQSIPLLGRLGVAQQLGSVEYTRPRRFTAKLSE